MNYDVQIGNTILRGISYAELVSLPIEPDTFVRRGNSDWIQAKDCVEITHVLAQRPVHFSRDVADNSNHYEESIGDEYYEYDTDDEDDVYDYNDYEEEHVEVPPYQQPVVPTYNRPVNPPPPPRQSYHTDADEERIFIPTAEYFKCKQKRKAAIIGVCTLGLAGLSLMGVGNTWRSNIFAGTSFMSNSGMAFVLKCVSFCFLTALIAIPYFIYSVFALIYYSIRLSTLKNR